MGCRNFKFLHPISNKELKLISNEIPANYIYH